MPTLCLLAAIAAPAPGVFSCRTATFSVSADGTAMLADSAGRPLCVAAPAAAVVVGGAAQPSTAAEVDGDRVTLRFGETGARAVLRITAAERHLTVDVIDCLGEGVGQLVLCDLPLNLKGTPGEPLAACALARNLRTNVAELPGPSSRLRATAEARFGLRGAGVALVIAPPEELREALQEAVEAAPELPHSPLGGPWAQDSPLNRSSYVFNFDGITMDQVDAWIERVTSLGFNQVQLHGGSQFRFGDCRLDPKVWPNGLADLRAVTDRLHAAGILVGMQPYAFFISKQSEWVTPDPDPRLASSARFTLAETVDAAADALTVAESTADVSLITGFFVRNSVTLRIDDELIVFGGVTTEPPYRFTQCQRGALGTTPAPHSAGATAYQLKECFGLFVPDAETSLFEDVAARTAQLFNEGGFDVIYFDALDGEDILGGADAAWHYGSRYVYEVVRRLERPAILEMSTFHHHLWCVRSRMGAWDHPNRGHRTFIDLHLAANQANARMYLPSNLGWWALTCWRDQQTEPTFVEDIEYLCCKAIGTDSGLSIVGYDPAVPAQQRLAGVVRQYEALRQAGTVPAAVRERLREPGAQFSLIEGRFHPATHARAAGRNPSLRFDNPYAAQPPRLRIEALYDAAAYDAPESREIVDFAAGTFATRHPNDGITADLQPVHETIDGRPAAARLTATSTRPARPGSWVRLEHAFAAPLDLSATQGLGLWIRGDGRGELLNIQLQAPQHISHGAIGEHYVDIDWTGWRYVELVEPDSDRWPSLGWPYGWSYAIFREVLPYGAIDRLSLWLNNLPSGEPVELYLSPIRALPLRSTPAARPVLRLGGQTATYPVDIPTGGYLEHRPGAPAMLYGPQGEPLGEAPPTGALGLEPGANELRVESPGRVRVTVGCVGDAI